MKEGLMVTGLIVVLALFGLMWIYVAGRMFTRAVIRTIKENCNGQEEA